MLKLPLKSLFFWSLSSVAFAYFPQQANALTAEELRQTAESITVRIEVERCFDENIAQPCPFVPAGSGVLVAARNSRTYYVLTANHVVKDIQTEGTDYRVITPDGKTYPLRLVTDEARKPMIRGADLALVAFDGSSRLSTANVSTVCVMNEWNGLDAGEEGNFPNSVFCQPRGDADQPLLSTTSQQVVVAGYPKEGENSGQFVLTLGSFIDRSSQSLAAQTPLAGGYEFLYTNPTEQGMSGGPILDTSGQLIGIHGQAEGDRLEGLIYGYSLGIPIDRFLRQFVQFLLPENLQFDSTPFLSRELAPQAITALLEGDIATCPMSGLNSDDFQELIQRGNRFFRLGNYEQSLNCLDRAIETNPASPLAYFVKGFVLLQRTTQQPAALDQKQNFEEVNQLFEQAITFATEQEPKYRDVYVFWRWQGVVLTQLEEYEQAVEAFQNAITACESTTSALFCQENQNYSQAWAGMAFALDKLERVDEAEQARLAAGDQTGYQGLIVRGRALYEVAKEELQRGEQATGQRRLEEALNTFDNAKNLVGESLAPEAWIGESRILNAQGKYIEAKTSFDTGIAEGAQYDEYTLKTAFEIASKNWDELASWAVNFYQTVTRNIAEDDAISYLAWYYQGITQFKYLIDSKRYNELSTTSLSSCNRAVELRPDFQPAIECHDQIQSIVNDIWALEEKCQEKGRRETFTYEVYYEVTSQIGERIEDRTSRLFGRARVPSGSSAVCVLVGSGLEFRLENIELVQEQNWY
ncbi:MAG: serine protease [Cyanobacteria bacterium RM1_2_2]|nr:serine protease [Cyanobacteria bacterium RM1_2_2]